MACALAAVFASAALGTLYAHSGSHSWWQHIVAYATLSPRDASFLEDAEATFREASSSAALAAAEATIARMPDCIAAGGVCALRARANGVIAEAHLLHGRLPSALDTIQTAIEDLEKGSPTGIPQSDTTERKLYARLHMTKGRVLEALPATKCAAGTCIEHAANAYRKALQVWPGLSEASAALSRVSASLSGASPAYVEALFDEYATGFDEALVERLDYRAPELLVAAVRTALGSRAVHAPVARALDAGCGTGLVGVRLRPLASHLTGVDLSSKMIERARARDGVYDALERSELVAFLRAVKPSERYALIACADVLNYLADLADVLAAAAAALEAGGLLAFTLELPAFDTAGRERESADWRWEPLPSGRYAHNAAWVVGEARRHGFELVERAAVPKLRVDGGVPVPGSLVVLAKD